MEKKLMSHAENTNSFSSTNTVDAPDEVFQARRSIKKLIADNARHHGTSNVPYASTPNNILDGAGQGVSHAGPIKTVISAILLFLFQNEAYCQLTFSKHSIHQV